MIPYVVYINTTAETSTREDSDAWLLLIDRIRDFGGDYFDVSTENGLQEAYAAIDERETVAVPLTHRALKVPIYSRFLLVSLALLVVGIPAGFLAELIWEAPIRSRHPLRRELRFSEWRRLAGMRNE